MPRMPKQFKVPSLTGELPEKLRPYTEMLDFFFRCIRTDLEKLEGVDLEDLLKQVKFKAETGNTVVGFVTLSGTMTPDLTGVYGCDLGDPLYNNERTYLLRKFNQDWWIWFDASSNRWYLSYAKGQKTGYRWYASELTDTWTPEGGVLV